MEDSSQGSRRIRPDSASSSNTRMTPTSSNGSAAHLPRNGRGTSGASLLQERLRERKVESARQNRDDPNAERGVQSSPVKSASSQERRPSYSGVAAAKGMGVKQMEDQVSTLHKQNFDLKLELYHRRQRQEGLESRLEAAERQIEEQAEMQEVNEQLLAELERRDQALDEAVGVIVTLEEKVDRLMQEREMVRTVDAQFETSYSHNMELSSTLSEFKEKRPTKGVVRMPSFLSDQGEGTEALRSLYLPQNHNSTDTTLPKLHEEESLDGMNSPRLSVLSESSFLSVYGERKLSLDNFDEPEPPPKRHRASSSVEKWVEERPAPTATPVRISPDLIRRKQYLSINDVLESPLQRLEKLKHTLEKHNSQPSRSNSMKEKRRSMDVLNKVFTDKASFELQQKLPPTPDTISTSTLRHYKNSNDTLAQDHDNTFLSTTSTFVPGLTYNAYQSALSMRPRSAGETVTSRRDGHGWDTETQEDLTETGSLTSTSSTCDVPFSRIKRVITPELFTFGAPDPDERRWGRDMMFNAETRLLAHHPRHRYDTLRQSSMVEHPQSDDTVVPSHSAVSRYEEQSGTSPIENSPKPDPPDRRSSLSAMAKLRKPSIPSATTSMASSSVVSNSNNITKKSRLTSRLFGRSETTGPAVSAHIQPQQAPQPPVHQSILGPKTSIRSKSYFNGAGYEDQNQARATPPPIRRSRTTAYRPSSAGTGMRRPSTFGYDGAGDHELASPTHGRSGSVDVGLVGVEEVEGEKGNGSGRKWYNGLRRN